MSGQGRPKLLTHSRTAGVFIVCVLLALFCQAARAAEGDGVQIEVSPATMQFAPGEAADVVLVIKNPLPTRADAIQLQWFSDVGLTVTPAPLNTKSIEAGGVVGWPVHLTTPVAGRTVGALHFWLRYRRAASGGRIPGVAVTTLTLQERPPLAIDKLVDGRLEAAVDQVNEKRAASMYLVITNRAAVPVTITRLQAHAPDFIRVTDDKGKQLGIPDSKDPLPPQSSRVFPIKAQATDNARAGNERLVFEVGLAWTDAGRPQSGSVLVAQTVPVGIFGESDILKLLGVPSFFMLPGFLALTMFGALWTRVAPKKKLEPGPTVAEFGLVAVTLSLIAMLIYPRFTHRDYLQGYGLRDVMLVWFGSVVFGLLAWMIAAGSINLRDRYRLYLQEQRRREEEARRQEEVSRRTPTTDDGPMAILEKLSLNQINFPLEQVEVRVDGDVERCFLLLPPDQSRPQAWVAPPVCLKRTGQVTRTREELVSDLAHPGVFENRQELTRVLKDAERAGWKATWGESGVIAGPTPVDAAHFKAVDKRAPGFLFVELS